MMFDAQQVIESPTSYLYYFDEEKQEWYRCALSDWIRYEANFDLIEWHSCHPPLTSESAEMEDKP